jgi:hypothetical protein
MNQLLRQFTTASITIMCFSCVVIEGGGPLVFDKQKLSSSPYESACAADLNNDGKLDIVCGEYWFEGPDFEKSHKMCSLIAVSDYHDDFGVYPMDVDGDGWVDIVSGGWFGRKLTWRKNPKGRTVEWQVHLIAEVGNIERPCFWDLDADGFAEIIPNLPSGPLIVFKLVRDGDGKGTGAFERYEISSKHQGHGLGFGDIDSDGRNDLVLSGGWYEAPEKVFEQEWKWHPDLNLSVASVPILVHDINADGRNDLIVGSAHGYGLAWWQQGDNGAWTRHDLEKTKSQYHEMRLADLNNNGKPELITGKRYHAHNGKDPGAEDPVGLYYYSLKDGKPKCVTIDYGAAGEASGAGIYMWIADIDKNGWNDIIAPGKEGLYLFRNQGYLKK